MAYRKIVVAVDCDNEQEVLAVQAAAKKMSEMFKLRGKDVLSVYPMIVKNGSAIATAIRTISQEGMKGVAKMLPYLIKNIKR